MVKVIFFKKASEACEQEVILHNNQKLCACNTYTNKTKYNIPN